MCDILAGMNHISCALHVPAPALLQRCALQGLALPEAVTVWEAIGDLPAILPREGAGGSSGEPGEPSTCCVVTSCTRFSVLHSRITA